VTKDFSVIDPTTGKEQNIEAEYSDKLESHLRYLALCLQWANAHKGFKGESTSGFLTYEAHFPWVIEQYKGRFRYWVWAGFLSGSYLLIHKEMSDEEKLATLLHEFFHGLFGTGEKKVQEKSIEFLTIIIENYELITHPLNKHHFDAQELDPRLLAKGQFEYALKYLEKTAHLFGI
jgi:hypothetical protein